LLGGGDYRVSWGCQAPKFSFFTARFRAVNAPFPTPLNI
jgi:hypothetical protein